MLVVLGETEPRGELAWANFRYQLPSIIVPDPDPLVFIARRDIGTGRIKSDFEVVDRLVGLAGRLFARVFLLGLVGAFILALLDIPQNELFLLA